MLRRCATVPPSPRAPRFKHGGRSLDITFLRRLGNLMLNTTVNVLFRTRFSDLCYGYNAFWRSALTVLDLPDTELPAPEDGSKLWGDGFEIETLINIRVARHYRTAVREVPSVEKERIYGESNLNAVRDGMRVMRTIFNERFTRSRAPSGRCRRHPDDPGQPRRRTAPGPAGDGRHRTADRNGRRDRRDHPGSRLLSDHLCVYRPPVGPAQARLSGRGCTSCALTIN